MEPGLVTVMIPSYNYAQYLEACVRSASAQQHADVVIVDNGSTDGSPQVAERLAAELANVRFVRHTTNDGIITSFNRCRQEVRGEFATLLCADDCLVPGSLARAVDLMNAHPGVGLGYGTALDFTDLGDVDLDQLPTRASTPIVHRGGDWVTRVCRTGLNPIRTPEAIIRSSVLADAGPYEPDCRYTSDLNMWLRIAVRSDVAYLPGPIQALFRQHESNVGRGFPHASAAELEQRWLAFDKFLTGLGADPRRAAWEGAARRRIGAIARYSASRAFVAARGEEPATELLAFAERVDPGGESLPERAGWAIRHRLGPGRARRFPGLLVRPVISRIARQRGQRRRQRNGLD